MPVQRSLYPPNWPEIARAVKEAAGWRCHWCGVKHGDIRTGPTGRTYSVVLSVHHPNGDTLNPDAELIPLCSRCHLRDDVLLHLRHARETLAGVNKLKPDNYLLRRSNFEISYHRSRWRRCQ